MYRQWIEDIFDDIEEPNECEFKGRKDILVNKMMGTWVEDHKGNLDFIRSLTAHCHRKNVIVHPIFLIERGHSTLAWREFLQNIYDGTRNAKRMGFPTYFNDDEFSLVDLSPECRNQDSEYRFCYIEEKLDEVTSTRHHFNKKVIYLIAMEYLTCRKMTHDFVSNIEDFYGLNHKPLIIEK